MSHVVVIQTKVHDPVSVAAACQRMGLPAPVEGTARLFDSEATGLVVKLHNWLFPAVVDTASGQVRYDNYGGLWGDQQHFDRFLQLYAVEKAKLEARKKGYSVQEQPLEDGSIKVEIVAGT